MRKQLNDQEIDRVNGGTVYLSRDAMKIGFSTLGMTFDLKNCSYYQALELVDTLFVQNSEMSEADFDKLVRKTFRLKGWI